MCRFQCFFAFIALSAGFVNSWDIAITKSDQIQFYENGEMIKNNDVKSSGLTAMAYDAVYNMLLYVDKQSDNASIFSYDLNRRAYRPLVKNSYDEIKGLAFDPMSGKLFWTDKNEKTIFWKSLRPGSNDDVTTFFKFDKEIPWALAVDSCRGYVYWTNINLNRATIERAKIDGSEREVIVNSDIYMPMGIAVDQSEKKIYWADDKEGIHFSIESADLDGKNKKTIATGIHHQPVAIAVSNTSLYWIDWDYQSVWMLPKTARNNDQEPFQLIKFNEMPHGIVANYKIADRTAGIAECAALNSLSKNMTAIKDSIDIPNEGLYCLHGVKMGKQECKCTLGYSGKRCETSVCQNYCLNGECSVSTAGQPQCSCKKDFTGDRCERSLPDLCNNFCLNDGTCTVQGQKPVCECLKGYLGDRCESKDMVPIRTPMARNVEDCNCTTQNATPMSSENLTANDGDFVQASCSTDGWDSVRDPIIMVLGTLSGLLCVASAVLVTKVMQLKKRPRIKKRIIVQKNSSTPLTARPEQCEITIENCCNMNICETPCFEPRSTIRPNLLDAKPGKEEKKNLIANMELPDDY